MKSIFDIQVQKLFLVTLILKVGSSFLGWYFQRQWSLGFAIPLLIMSAYIVLGYFRRDSDVNDEKFADSCYYLGFIFTITSIIFSLFDLPNIGTKIQEIAVRFGAAMVSTVLGLGVRVYLVSFKKDVGDAIKEAEDAVLDVTKKLTEHLKIALEKLCDFESQVDTAAKSSVERVNMQIDNLSKNHAEKLSGFFNDLTNRNQEAFTQAMAEVKTASQRLSDSVDGYSHGMRSNLSSIEIKVGAFTEAVTDRLKTTTFPDDYFAKHLDGPLNQLKDSASILAGGVKMASDEVRESSTVLSKTLTKLREKANVTEDSLDTVLKLTVQQQAVLDSAQGQLTTLGQLTSTLTNFDASLTNTMAGITASNAITSELTERVSSVVAENVETRMILDKSLAAVIGKLDFSATATSTVAEKLDANAIATTNAAAKMALQQQAIFESAQSQLTTLTQLTTTLASFDTALSSTVEGLTASHVVTSELTTRVSSVIEEGAETRKSLDKALAAVIEKLNFSATATSTVAQNIGANAMATTQAAATVSSRLEANTAATNSVIAMLEATGTASGLIAMKLDSVAAADVQTAATLGALGQHATKAIDKVDQAVDQLQGMVRQLSSLDAALRAQSSDLKQVADRIKDVKVIVEIPPAPLHILTNSPAALELPMAKALTMPDPGPVNHRSFNHGKIRSEDTAINQFQSEVTQPVSASNPTIPSI